MQPIDLFVLYPVFFLVFFLVCLCNLAESPLPSVKALFFSPPKPKEERREGGEWRVANFFTKQF